MLLPIAILTMAALFPPAGGMIVAEEAETPPPMKAGLLDRVIRRFDFEDRELSPVDLPAYFHRVGPLVSGTDTEQNDAARPGHPLFGRMSLSREQPYAGRWSFLFELEGGSMTARIPPKVLPILPGATYEVSVAIRTEGLQRSRARLVALYYDQHGRALPRTRVEGPFVLTGGEWERSTILVPAHDPAAVDLVVELQLLQPSLFPRQGHNPHEPLLEDVRGRAWFDDLIIRHVPHIELAPVAPSGIFHDTRAALMLTVSDMTNESLTAHFLVEDHAGNVVHHRRLPVGRQTIRQRLEFAAPAFGWYRAAVVVADGPHIHALARRDLLVTPAPSERMRTVRLGLSLEHEPIATLRQTAMFIHELGLRIALLPAWDDALTIADSHEQYVALRGTIEPLLAGDTEMIFVLPALPRALAADLALDPKQTVQALARDNREWLPYLQPVLINLGERVRSWQIGSSGDESAFWRDQAAETAAVAQALERFVARPIIITPWRSEHGLPRAGVDVNLHLAHHVPPASLIEYAEHWPVDDPDLLVTVEPLPTNIFSVESRATDLILRGLHLWRMNVRRMVLPTPWIDSIDRSPDPLLGVWAQLGERLNNRTFAGEVSLKRGVRAWLLDGPDGASLVVWKESASAEAALRTKLADHAVVTIDPFGNKTAIALAEGIHTITLGEIPIFIEGVDPYLLRFRQGLTITPDRAPSLHRAHEHELIISNPWPVMITGTLRFTEPEAWTFEPRRQNFTVGPGESVRLPLTLTIGRSELIGSKRLALDLLLQADRTHELRLELDFDLHHPNLAASPLWRVSTTSAGRRDIIIDYYITNTGDQERTVEAFLLAPGYPRERRIVSSLPPGQTVVRSFVLADGVAQLAEKSIMIGVVEADEGGRINQRITFPRRPSGNVLSGTTQASASDR